MGRDYSFIATDRPANRTAAVVLQKGQHFEHRPDDNIFDAPLPVLGYTGPTEFCLIGERFFRFKVVGYLGKNSRKCGKWLLRCDCGKYTVRSGKIIKTLDEEHGKCGHCQELEYIKSEKHRERFLKKIKKGAGDEPDAGDE